MDFRWCYWEALNFVQKGRRNHAKSKILIFRKMGIFSHAFVMQEWHFKFSLCWSVQSTRNASNKKFDPTYFWWCHEISEIYKLQPLQCIAMTLNKLKKIIRLDFALWNDISWCKCKNIETLNLRRFVSNARIGWKCNQTILFESRV